MLKAENNALVIVIKMLRTIIGLQAIPVFANYSAMCYMRDYEFVLADNNVLPGNQIAFQKGSRASDDILVLETRIDKHIHIKLQNHICSSVPQTSNCV